MPSHLDLSKNANDDPHHQIINSTKNKPSQRCTAANNKSRREKRLFHDSSLEVNSQQSLVRSVGDFAFVMMFKVVMAFFGVMLRAISLLAGRGRTSNTSWWETAVDPGSLLNEMSHEQQAQRREVSYISGNQAKQREELDQLRSRIQRIESRRKEREAESKQMLDGNEPQKNK